MLPTAARSASAMRRLTASDGLLARFERLRGGSHPWLLDSALPSQRLGRFSFAGADPYLVLRARGGRVELDCRRAVRPGLVPGRHELEADPLEVVRRLLPSPPEEDVAPGVPFVGGAVAALGYELAECTEPVRLHGLDDLQLPDAVLLFVDRTLAWDHTTGEAFAFGTGFAASAGEARARARRAADELADTLLGPVAPTPPRAPTHRPTASPYAFFDAAGYAKAVDAVLEEIAAGNVYQANLTHRVECDHAGDAWSLYRELRRRNPAPFASYLELPEASIVSSSPERFLRLAADGEVESRPIKGTRPRGRDAAEDASLRRDLARSEKDRAENLMIVDLVRNDLGRVCEIGSVDVPERMAIEDYASVFQMVSTVRGRLRPDRDVVDLLRATFPPGSMTGAPKIAAMRLCDRLEPVRRGIYSGAIGYFDVRGGADLSVTIRTILLRQGRAYVHAGGAIVADSDPLGEYRETLDKARPLLAALGAPP